MNEQFDAVVIGSGQGGTPLAVAMAAHGWKTALVERKWLGGVCTNDGCTPTKTMVASARVAAMARRGAEYGVGCEGLSIDFARVMQRQRDLSSAGRKRIEERLSQQSNVEVIYGEASFAEAQSSTGGHAISVRSARGTPRALHATRVFLDVGQRPEVPAIEGLEDVPYLDSSSILQLGKLPGRLLIVGGGYIAVEFAQIFRRLGAEVILVERGPQLLAHEDADLATCLTAVLQEEGVTVLLEAKVCKVRGGDGAVFLEYEQSEGQFTVEGTHLLIATGRVPCTEALHLDRAGVRLTESKFIEVNERLETSAQGIWALGDVTGGPAYTHAAYDDFRILRANLLEGGSRTTTERVVPYCIFTDPELGRIGLSETEARRSGRAVMVGTIAMSKVARATEMGETRGMLKVVVERGSGKLLGAAALSVGGGEIMSHLQIAMLGGLTAEVLREAIFVHPVLAEGLHPLMRALH